MSISYNGRAEIMHWPINNNCLWYSRRCYGRLTFRILSRLKRLHISNLPPLPKRIQTASLRNNHYGTLPKCIRNLGNIELCPPTRTSSFVSQLVTVTLIYSPMYRPFLMEYFRIILCKYHTPRPVEFLKILLLSLQIHKNAIGVR